MQLTSNHKELTVARKAKEEEVTEEEATSRSQMYKHEAFVEWASGNGVDLDSLSAAEVVAYFAANRNAFRKSDIYTSAVADRAGERDAAKAERAQLRAAKAADAKAAKATKATKAPAKAAKKTPAKKTPAKRAGKTAATSTEESPFD